MPVAAYERPPLNATNQRQYFHDGMTVEKEDGVCNIRPCCWDPGATLSRRRTVTFEKTRKGEVESVAMREAIHKLTTTRSYFTPRFVSVVSGARVRPVPGRNHAETDVPTSNIPRLFRFHLKAKFVSKSRYP